MRRISLHRSFPVVLVLSALITFTGSRAQGVGIGTSSPSANAVLDVNSDSKGLMLPRISDTGRVASPSAGLMIYNMNAKSPAFHNGSNWQSMAAGAGAVGTATDDSITYQFLNTANTSFDDDVQKLFTLSHGFDGALAPFTLTKPFDVNTLPLIKAVLGRTVHPALLAIEFKFYRRGSNTPYYSIKGTTLFMEFFQTAQGNGYLEQIWITPSYYGYKNWETNISFSYKNGAFFPY